MTDKETLNEILANQRQQSADITLLTTAIVGNQMGTTGLAPRLNNVEKFQHKMKKQIWMTMGGTFVIAALAKYWDKFFG